jgi:hypothetical protein
MNDRHPHTTLAALEGHDDRREEVTARAAFGHPRESGDPAALDG